MKREAAWKEAECGCVHGGTADICSASSLPCELTAAEDIYSWSRFCPLADVRIIIVGE